MITSYNLEIRKEKIAKQQKKIEKKDHLVNARKGKKKMKKKTVKKNKSMKYNEDFFAHAKKVLGKKRYDEAILKGNKKADEIRLKMAREIIGKNQTEFKGLTQPEVSKIEARKDMKISTLVKYAKGLGLKVKISLVSEDEKHQTISIYG